MAELWGRVWSLQVGALLLEGLAPDTGADLTTLAVEFTVKKSLTREPNEAEITIRNLGREHRAAIAAMGADATVILKAGYQETGLEQIFSGDLRASPASWDGAQVTTTLEGSDGGRTYRSARIQRSFAPGTPVYTVLAAAVDALGVGQGNLPYLRSQIRLTATGDTYPGGTTLSGPARDEVSRIVRGCGGSWSIQNGNFQLRLAGPARRTALLATPRTGLVGSPSQETDRGRTVVKAEVLLLPGLYPGRIVQIESREVEGNFEIFRVEYKGETRGDAWGATLELRPY